MEEEKQELSAEEYVKRIQELQNNTVSKEDYEALNKKHIELMDAVLNNTNVNKEPETKEKKVKDVAKEYIDLVNHNCTNLEGFEKALELRRVAMKELGKDPFMNQGLENLQPDFGEQTAKALQKLVDDANGSASVFDGMFKDALNGKSIQI